MAINLPIKNWAEWEDATINIGTESAPDLQVNPPAAYVNTLTRARQLAKNMNSSLTTAVPDSEEWDDISTVTDWMRRLGMRRPFATAGTEFHRDGQISAKIGNLGDRNTQMRKDWWKNLQAMNYLLSKARDMGSDVAWGSIAPQVAPRSELGSGPTARDTFWNGHRTHVATATYNDRPTPDLFVFSRDELTGDIWIAPFSIVSRMVTLHNKLWGAQLGATRDNRLILQVDRGIANALIMSVATGLYLIEAEILRLEALALEEERAELEAELLVGSDNVEGFRPEPLIFEEVQAIQEQPEYQQYFSTTFNRDLITFVPIVQNFVLTGKYFRDLENTFRAPNALALQLLISTIRNDDNYKSSPANLPSSPRSDGAINQQLDQHSEAARDFILKMLLMAPINILKGLCELVDPHVGITKLIKKITGYAFDELAEVLNEPAEGINEARRGLIEEMDGPEAAENFRGINGDDLLKLILCIIDSLMKGVEQIPEDPNAPLPPPPPGFFPAIERDGIDFTGKGLGLLMMPPTPLGLIYLLLGLIKFDDGEVTDALSENIPESGCLPAPDEEVITESDEGEPCDPEQLNEE